MQWQTMIGQPKERVDFDLGKSDCMTLRQQRLLVPVIEGSLSHASTPTSIRNQNNSTNTATSRMAKKLRARKRQTITLRYDSSLNFFNHWNGSITQSNWHRVVGYIMYLVGILMFYEVSCNPRYEKAHQGSKSSSGICAMTDDSTAFTDICKLGLIFVAFLFTSYVNAGITKYRRLLQYTHNLQGGFNGLQLLLHSHFEEASPKDYNMPCVPSSKTKTDSNPTLKATQRLLKALAYAMFADRNTFQNHLQADGFHNNIRDVLTTEEFNILFHGDGGCECDEETQPGSTVDCGINTIPPVDRPYVLMAWINRICQTALSVSYQLQSQSCPDNEPMYFLLGDTTGTSLSHQMSKTFESIRGDYEDLLDAVEDPVLPLQFSNLIMFNVYLIFLILPFRYASSLNLGLILAGTPFFWLLDGMIQFVFFCEQPFRTTPRYNMILVLISSLITAGSCKQKQFKNYYVEPLIDLRIVVEEMVSALPRRFPLALNHPPSSITKLSES